MACSCCSGTDCAAACSQGQCYAEEYQRQQQAEWNAREEEAYRIYADHNDAFDAIVGLARWAFGLCAKCGVELGTAFARPAKHGLCELCDEDL